MINTCCVPDSRIQMVGERGQHALVKEQWDVYKGVEWRNLKMLNLEEDGDS